MCVSLQNYKKHWYPSIGNSLNVTTGHQFTWTLHDLGTFLFACLCMYLGVKLLKKCWGGVKCLGIFFSLVFTKTLIISQLKQCPLCDLFLNQVIFNETPGVFQNGYLLVSLPSTQQHLQHHVGDNRKLGEIFLLDQMSPRFAFTSCSANNCKHFLFPITFCLFNNGHQDEWGGSINPMVIQRAIKT